MKVILVCIFILAVAFSAKAVNIDLVTVGNPGNAPIVRPGPVATGAVGYIYQIGKYEVTASQYTEFLNAVAKADPNGLYNPNMGNPADPYDGANIQRTGASPNYSYSVAADWANRPVNQVSFWDAARFANWLHNGQPTGAQGPGTTEGGAYHDIGDQTLFGRNAEAKFFIPTEAEWYKAAYHKNDGITGNYWSYPAASDTAPINTLPDTGNHANFYDYYWTGNRGFTLGPPYLRTDVGAFADSASPYGTFDQGGNVIEWTETATFYASGAPARVIRGGAFNTESDTTHAAYSGPATPIAESGSVGFRIAVLAVPEPAVATTAAMALTAFAFAFLRRKSVPHNRV